MPERFVALYEAKGVRNASSHRFVPDGPERTRWIEEEDFQFSGLMRLMGLVMRASFPKQTEDTMRRFKEFAESASGRLPAI
jgi:hypothetical protein